MRAVVRTKYGPPDVLELREVTRPVARDNQVLVQVHATTVTVGDRRLRGADPPILRFQYGLIRPKVRILGMEVAGEIESVGKDVSRFREGDQVFGVNIVGGVYMGGTYAEYLCLSEDDSVATMPANMTYQEAAAVPDGAIAALQCLRKANVRGGQQVLIYGASGSIGTFAVQLAKYFGAHVTGVCSTTNVQLVKSLGADDVIDYAKEDFAKSGRTYDVILDVVAKNSFSNCRRSLKERGIYLRTMPTLPLLLQMLWTSKIGSKKATMRTESHSLKNLFFVRELVEAGEIKPAIDRRYPLEQIAEAHRYVDKGHKKGSVVITVRNGS